jgi:hypothetical protein
MPGLFDNVGTHGGLLGMLTGRSNGSLAGAVDPERYQLEQQQQQQQATFNAILPLVGNDRNLAAAAALQPEILKQIAPQLNNTPQIVQGPPDPFGSVQWFAKRGGANPSVTQMPVQQQGGEAGGMPANNGFMASGINQVNSGLQGQAYLEQFRPEVQAAVKAYMAGDVMPTGNPRSKGIADMAKTIAQKVGPEMGLEVSDTAYQAKRKLRTDLASSSPNTMGGILSNGASAFDHLATVGDKFEKLHNYSGTSIPLIGGRVAEIGNKITNEVNPSPQTLENLRAARGPLLKYGQESTKFYAGTGGSEGERTDPSKTMDPAKTSPLEQASFLDSEKELMLKRFHEKENQVVRELGPEYLQRHPIITPEMKQTIAHIDQTIGRLRAQAGGQEQPTDQQPAAAGATQPNGGFKYLGSRAQ